MVSFTTYKSLVDGSEIDGIPDIDDFEDSDLSEYSGDTGSFGFTTESYVGTYALVCNGGSENYYIYSPEGGGLNYYPSAGDTIKLWWYADGNQEGIIFHWATNGAVRSSTDGYAVKLERINYNQAVFRYDGGSSTELASDGSTIADNEWYEIEISWGSDGSIDVTLRDTDENTVLTMSATDSTYTGGGIGYFADPSHRIDYVRAEK